jgi:hypothetical protein
MADCYGALEQINANSKKMALNSSLGTIQTLNSEVVAIAER